MTTPSTTVRLLVLLRDEFDGRFEDPSGQVRDALAEILDVSAIYLGNLLGQLSSSGLVDRDPKRGKGTTYVALTEAGYAKVVDLPSGYLANDEAKRLMDEDRGEQLPMDDPGPAEFEHGAKVAKPAAKLTPEPDEGEIDLGPVFGLDPDAVTIAEDDGLTPHQRKSKATRQKRDDEERAAIDRILTEARVHALDELGELPESLHELLRERRIMRRQLASKDAQIRGLQRRLRQLADSYTSLRHLYDVARSNNTRLSSQLRALNLKLDDYRSGRR